MSKYDETSKNWDLRSYYERYADHNKRCLTIDVETIFDTIAQEIVYFSSPTLQSEREIATAPMHKALKAFLKRQQQEQQEQQQTKQQPGAN